MRRSLTAVLAVLALILAGCGGDDDSADGGTCEDLAGDFITLMQDTIDAAESMDLEEIMAAGEEEPEFLADLETKGEELEGRQEELGCTDEEMEQLVCDRIGEIETEGIFADAITSEFTNEC